MQDALTLSRGWLVLNSSMICIYKQVLEVYSIKGGFLIVLNKRFVEIESLQALIQVGVIFSDEITVKIISLLFSANK